MIAIRAATDADFDAITALLDALDLPVSDLRGHPNIELLIAEEQGVLIGAVGLEVYGGDALFRSLAVVSRCRNRGVAARLSLAAIATAKAQGVSRFYLLTTTAARYFESRGWQTINRDRVPAVISGTTEFDSLCPDDATCMTLDLQQVPPPVSG